MANRDPGLALFGPAVGRAATSGTGAAPKCDPPHLAPLQTAAMQRAHLRIEAASVIAA